VATLRAAGRDRTHHGALRLPRAVGYLPERHLALFTVAPGRPLNQLDRAAVPEAMAALGAALSVLHSQHTEGFAPFTRLDPDRVVDAGRLVAAARPDLGALAGDVVAALLASPPPPRAAVLLHGDLHPKNVLVHEAGVSLVDLDQAGTGPAAAELGGTLARLWCPRPGDPIADETAAEAGEALLSAYDRRPAHRDLLWHAAAALLVERAVRAICRVDLAGIADLERVLATALRWAASPGGEL
jgi:Ser/Thr protein kinase RdoA (MazF antagonist)